MTKLVQVLRGTVWAPAASYPGTGFTVPETPPANFQTYDPNDQEAAVAAVNRCTPPTMYTVGQQCELNDQDAQNLSAGNNPQVAIVT